MLVLALALPALAADPLPEVRAPDAPEAQITGFALFQTRTAASDLASTNPLLDGQVVGRLGGTNGVVVDPAAFATYTEQRLGVFATFTPRMLDGKAALTGAFELDWAWGDRSYGVAGNTGGAFGGDMVNLQTRRLQAEFFPKLGPTDWHVVAGLQLLTDSVNDPTGATPDALFRSGGKLMFFGSEASGLAAYGRLRTDWGDRAKWRLGTFTLYEQGLSLPDDVWLLVSDVEVRPTWTTTAGLHAWYLQDRAGGTAGALGSGPASALSELQGGPLLDPYAGVVRPEGAAIDADLVWLGADVGHNAALDRGPVGVTASAFLNMGRVYATVAQDTRVGGALVDAEARWRYAQGEGSVLRAEALWTTADGANATHYGGVVTGNSYGIAGALYASHGMVLLFPDPGSINRMVAVVSDVSGAGRGVTAGMASAGYDLVPDRLTATLNAGTALDGAGQSWGTEGNLRVSATPLPLVDVAVTAAACAPGPASGITDLAWAGYLTLDWLLAP